MAKGVQIGIAFGLVYDVLHWQLLCCEGLEKKSQQEVKENF